MTITEAHVFQHKYNGVQMLVFHLENEIRAREKFYDTVGLFRNKTSYKLNYKLL